MIMTEARVAPRSDIFRKAGIASIQVPSKQAVTVLHEAEKDDILEEKTHGSATGLGGYGEKYFLEKQVSPSIIDQGPSHGPANWTTKQSVELQEAIDTFQTGDFCNLNFSVTVADPESRDCPLIACSIGFTELTGYQVHEIVGRNCRFLLNGVPDDLIEPEVRRGCRTFIQSAKSGKSYSGCAEVLPQGVSKCAMLGPAGGELICVQANARKSGALFKNMFYLRQVEVDCIPLIIALQAELPEELENEDGSGPDLQRQCSAAWAHLDDNMATIEKVLAADFMFQAPMRRQQACKPMEEIVQL